LDSVLSGIPNAALIEGHEQPNVKWSVALKNLGKTAARVRGVKEGRTQWWILAEGRRREVQVLREPFRNLTLLRTLIPPLIRGVTNCINHPSLEFWGTKSMRGTPKHTR